MDEGFSVRVLDDLSSVGIDNVQSSADLYSGTPPTRLSLPPRFTSPRSGEVEDSEAEMTAGGRNFGYFDVVGLHAGRCETIEWQTSLARAAGA